MSELYNLLLLDDEVEILNSLKRVFRKDFNVFTFTNGQDALDAMSERIYAVIISDMKMPEMNGATFLTKAREISPDSIRILLTGHSEVEDTVAAINEGGIFSYISKPWRNDDLRVSVKNALDQYKLKHENQQLTNQLKFSNKKLKEINGQLEVLVKKRTQGLQLVNNKLAESIKKQKSFFQNLLDMVNLIIEDREGENNGHNKRVANHAKLLAESLNLEKNKVTEIYFASLMHNIGKVSLSDDLLQKSELEFSNEQKTQYLDHAVEGAKILSKLPSLAGTAKIIGHQFEKFDGTGVPSHLSEEEIPMGSRILSVVRDYDKLLLGNITGNHLSPEEAMSYLTENASSAYDPNIIKGYKQLLKRFPESDEFNVDYCVSVENLQTGMCLAKDVLNKAGSTVLTQNTILTDNAIEKLKGYEEKSDYHFSIFVY